MRICTAAFLTLVPTVVHATEIVEFTDRAEWEAAAGAFTTIDFTGFPAGTFIIDQYASLCAAFTDGQDVINLTEGFVNDGAGINGVTSTTIEFDRVMTAVAVDFPGFVSFQLFRDDELLAESNNFGIEPHGNFAGIVSPEPFDTVVVLDPIGNTVFIDDVHFGRRLRYRVTDLGTFDGVNSTPLGINNPGQVVGSSNDRAFIWLPAPMYGLEANSMIPLAPDMSSEARAINDLGQITGRLGSFPSETAFLWVPVASLGLVSQQMQALQPGSDLNSGWDLSNPLNERGPLYVVGKMTDATCGGAFLWCSDDPQQMVALSEDTGPRVEWIDFSARGIRPEIATAEQALIVGFGNNCIEFGECQVALERGAVTWDDLDCNDRVDNTVSRLELPPAGETSRSEALDVNTAGQIVGVVRDSALGCDDRAVFWDNDSTPVTLDRDEQQTRANALNEPTMSSGLSFVQVVGDYGADGASSRRAALWERRGSQFEFVELNDHVACDAPLLLEATDINDSGWIVCIGDYGPGGQRAVLLTPICPADLDDDGSVGFADLTQLLGTWGQRSNGAIWRIDLNMDGRIGFADLTTLLNAWGPCPVR